MSDIVPIRRALISVSDKSGLVAFAAALAAQGVRDPVHRRLGRARYAPPAWR